jgi:hypothetical protein
MVEPLKARLADEWIGQTVRIDPMAAAVVPAEC